MAAVAMSIVDYMHELKDAGFTDRQSEVQAKKIEQVVVEIQNGLATKQDLEELRLSAKKDLALTKKDLELAIEKLRYESLRFTVWTGIGVIAAVGSMLAKGFHWF